MAAIVRKTWRHVLGGFLGWTDNRIHNYIREHETDIYDGNALFYHETPLYWVSRMIYSPRFHGRLDFNVVAFEHGLLGAIKNGDHNCEWNQDFDWDSARERVDQFLRGYGESLESIRQDYATGEWCDMWR